MRRLLVDWPAVGLRLPGFGMALLMACFGALMITAWRARREKIDPESVFELAVWLMSGGFIGARLLFLVAHPETIRGVSDVFRIWQGGIVYYGCILGGLVGSLIYWWRRPFPFLAMADAVAPALALGCAIGRVGCFLNGCCFGGVCDLPWAVAFPRGTAPWATHVGYGWIPADAQVSLPVHPTQLYSVLDGLILLALLNAFYPRRRRDGEVMALLMVTYPVTRFLIERLRDDEPAWVLGMTLSQAISVAIFAAGVATWAYLSSRPRVLYRDQPETGSSLPDGIRLDVSQTPRESLPNGRPAVTTNPRSRRRP